MKKLSLIAILAIVGWTILPACTVVQTNTAIDDDALIFLYEEEKLAMDIYNYFESAYGLMPFINISESEQHHFTLMENLLIDEGIISEDEVIRSEAGIFIQPGLQELYDDLLSRGEESPTEALTVGAYIEEHDIRGLEDMAQRTEDINIKEAMMYLAAASKNHLRAFHRNLENRGVDYVPEILDQDYFNQIIGSSQGGRHQNGRQHPPKTKTF